MAMLAFHPGNVARTVADLRSYIVVSGSLNLLEICQLKSHRRFAMATINLRNVSDDLHRKAKARAAMEGVSLKQLILRLLEEYLDGVC
jgi:predicted HicB family RNase H-like nuclease